MKTPFSYRHQFFLPVLTLSLLGHGIFFGMGGFGAFSPKPQFGVEQAPSSMEVVIFKEESQSRPERQPEARVLTSPDAEAKIAAKKEIKPEEEKKITKPVYIPSQRGALTRNVSPYLKNPAPVYPNLARENGWEGVVVLKVLVQQDGAAGRVEVQKSSGYKILDTSAVDTVQKWKFKPAGIGNMSFASWVRIPIHFKLTDE